MNIFLRILMVFVIIALINTLMIGISVISQKNQDSRKERQKPEQRQEKQQQDNQEPEKKSEQRS